MALQHSTKSTWRSSGWSSCCIRSNSSSRSRSTLTTSCGRDFCSVWTLHTTCTDVDVDVHSLQLSTARPIRSIRRVLLLPTVQWTIIISMASEVSDTTAVRVAMDEIPAANEDDSKRYRCGSAPVSKPPTSSRGCMNTAPACGRQQKQLWPSLGNYVTKQAANMMILLLPWSSCR